jgi:hypothetical protein
MVDRVRLRLTALATTGRKRQEENDYDDDGVLSLPREKKRCRIQIDYHSIS